MALWDKDRPDPRSHLNQGALADLLRKELSASRRSIKLSPLTVPAFCSPRRSAAHTMVICSVR